MKLFPLSVFGSWEIESNEIKTPVCTLHTNGAEVQAAPFKQTILKLPPEGCDQCAQGLSQVI